MKRYKERYKNDECNEVEAGSFTITYSSDSCKERVQGEEPLDRLKKPKNWYDWGMAKQLVRDEFWQTIAALLPPEPVNRKAAE